MNKVKRRRNHAVTIRMSESEYNDFINKVNESGLSQQTYFINAVRGATITPSDEINVLKDISRTFSSLERQLRGLATNVNQMAHVANATGNLPTGNEMERVSDQLNNYRRESESVWQSIRSLMGQQKRTEQ